MHHQAERAFDTPVHSFFGSAGADSLGSRAPSRDSILCVEDYMGVSEIWGYLTWGSL